MRRRSRGGARSARVAGSFDGSAFYEAQGSVTCLPTNVAGREDNGVPRGRPSFMLLCLG